jgi:hypothetical protein
MTACLGFVVALLQINRSSAARSVSLPHPAATFTRRELLTPLEIF